MPVILLLVGCGAQATALTAVPSEEVEEATTEAKIAFMSYRDGNHDIHIMNVDGSEQVRLTNNPTNDYAPSFSP